MFLFQFNILEEEFLNISNYIAITKDNLSVYSNKIHDLHLRCCSDLENLLKLIIHRDFVSEEDVLKKWEEGKSKKLKSKGKLEEYIVFKKSLNLINGKQVERYLFGFPDFQTYFLIACEKFNLDKKMVILDAALDDSYNLYAIQPSLKGIGLDIPKFWNHYNKIKHDRINNYKMCNLEDLLNSLGSYYILMNYLYSYCNNNPTFDHGKSVNNNQFSCDYKAVKSKIFRHTVSAQKNEIDLPEKIHCDEYESFIQKYDLRNLVREYHPGIDVYDKLIEKQHCIFHVYYDYLMFNYPYKEKKLLTIFNN
jgi:hypothetical protein